MPKAGDSAGDIDAHVPLESDTRPKAGNSGFTGSTAGSNGERGGTGALDAGATPETDAGATDSGQTSGQETGDKDPGNSKESALNLGSLSTYTRPREYVGLNDASDYFCFQVPGNGVLTYTLSQVSGSVRLQLYRDAAQLTPSSLYAQMDATAGREAPVDFVNLEKGKYYARTSSNSTGSSALYDMTLTFELSPYAQHEQVPGGDKGTAAKLGIVDELITVSGFVGRASPNDFYEIEIDRNTNLTLSAEVLQKSYVTIALHANAEIIDPQTRVTAFSLSSGSMTPAPVVVAAGVYFIRVTTASSYDSLYQLSLSTSD